jgi:hypothetical protein
MSTYPIRAREDKAWQDGYTAGRGAALAELHTALAETKRLNCRLADVIKVHDMEVVRREAGANLLAAADDDRAASGAVVFGHNYLLREAGDGSGTDLNTELDTARACLRAVEAENLYRATTKSVKTGSAPLNERAAGDLHIPVGRAHSHDDLPLAQLRR